MKISSLFSVLFLVAVSMTACTPKDAPVVSDSQRKIFDEKSQTRSSAKTDFSVVFKPREFVSATVLLQKHVEALELVAAVLGNLDETQTNYKFGSKQRIGQTVEVPLFLMESGTPYLGSYGASTLTSSKKFVGTVDLESSEGYILNISGKRLGTLASLNEKEGHFVFLKEQNYSLSIERNSETGILLLEVVSNGVLDGAKGKEIAKIGLDMKLKMEIEEASLTSTHFQFKIISSEFVLTHDRKSRSLVYMEGENMTFNLKDRCTELQGSVMVNSEFTMVINPSTVSIPDKKWSLLLPSCESRPSVDLISLLDMPKSNVRK